MKMQNSSSLITQPVARDNTTGGITGEAARTGEGVMMLGSQAMAQMQKGGGVALILNTSQLVPTNPQTSSRPHVPMNKVQGLQLQDQCTGSAATTGATAPLVVTLSSGILPLPQPQPQLQLQPEELLLLPQPAAVAPQPLPARPRRLLLEVALLGPGRGTEDLRGPR